MKEIINKNAWLIVFILFTILGCLFSGCKDNSEAVIFRQYKGCDYIKFEGYFGWSHSGTCPNPIHKCKCN